MLHSGHRICVLCWLDKILLLWKFIKKRTQDHTITMTVYRCLRPLSHPSKGHTNSFFKSRKCVWVHVRVWVCVWVCLGVSACVCECMCVYVCVWLYVWVCVCVSACMCVFPVIDTIPQVDVKVVLVEKITIILPRSRLTLVPLAWGLILMMELQFCFWLFVRIWFSRKNSDQGFMSKTSIHVDSLGQEFVIPASILINMFYNYLNLESTLL